MSQDQAAPLCPTCHGSGEIKGVSTVFGNSKVLRVTYRCPACGAEWQVIEHDPFA